MDKVNFLQQNGQPKRKEKNKAENKQPRDDWTEAVVDNNDQAASKSGKQKIQNIFGRFGMSKKEPVNKLEDKEKQRVRREVLANIKDKNTDSRIQRETGAAAHPPSGLMERIFPQADKTRAGVEREVLSDKEAIARAREVASQEREQRRNGLSGLGETDKEKILAVRKEAEPAKPPVASVAVRPAAKTDSSAKLKLSKNKSDWRAPKILKTNLAGGELTAFFNWRKFFKSLAANLFLACLLISVAYVSLVLWEMKVNREGDLIGAEIDNLTQRVIQLEKKITAADELQRKIELARFLIDKHIYWTNFFALLERSTLEEVYYTGAFSGDVNQAQFTLAAEAKSYADISNQIKAMEHDESVASVDVKSGTMATGKSKSEEPGASDVQFQLVFSIKPELFTQ